MYLFSGIYSFHHGTFCIIIMHRIWNIYKRTCVFWIDVYAWTAICFSHFRTNGRRSSLFSPSSILRFDLICFFFYFFVNQNKQTVSASTSSIKIHLKRWNEMKWNYALFTLFLHICCKQISYKIWEYYYYIQKYLKFWTNNRTSKENVSKKEMFKWISYKIKQRVKLMKKKIIFISTFIHTTKL